MKLRDYILEQLAEMVIGDNDAFPYKSSSYITRFFDRCGLPFVHDGSTRKRWTADRLKELNRDVSAAADLPSKMIVRVIQEMFDVDDFDRGQKSADAALEELNKVLCRQGLKAYFDQSKQCQVMSTGTGVHTASAPLSPRPLSAEEIRQRNTVASFLDTASEDEFTQQLLTPLFLRLGFHRVSPSGHKEKNLEFGKDLWMKYQLPTNHWLYFGAQVKREKLDARAGSANSNTATVLNQIRMALDHPIFDPDIGRKVLVDHVFVISAREITRSARNWLVEKLDQSQRRHLIFMDRDEFLDLSARILRDLQIGTPNDVLHDDDVPF